ncbi:MULTISPECIES: hypothetical protein [unclassified Nostoc]|uniref:hypothetical protein n=1 Tax=unclassified Nostoc TaxID=2593658 RepID=UPI0025E273ED|nr:hypothetical protein [Nostoc sp. JL31]MBN3892154.1 hypothetical protein [Nostoc sp. JL31]
MWQINRLAAAADQTFLMIVFFELSKLAIAGRDNENASIFAVLEPAIDSLAATVQNTTP